METTVRSGGARRVFRNTALQVGADVASKFALLALFAVVARSLGDVGFGEISFAIAIVSLMEFASLGADVELTRAIARSPAAVDQLFWESVTIKVATAVVGAAAIAVFLATVGYPAQVWSIVALMAATKLLELVALTIYAVFRGFEDARPVATGFIVERFFIAATGVTALLWLDAGAIAVAAAYLGGALVALAYAATRFVGQRLRPPVKLSFASARHLFIASLPLGLSSAFGLVLARFDAVLLSPLTNTATVGLYGAAARLFEATAFLSYAFGIASFPLLSRLGARDRAGMGRALTLACKATALVLFPAGALLAVHAPRVVEIFYGSDFGGAFTATRLMGPATAVFGMFVMGGYALAAQDRERTLATILGVVAATNIALNLTLIPLISLDGSAAAFAASITAGAVAMLASASRHADGFSVVRMTSTATLGTGCMVAIWILADSLPGFLAGVAAYGIVTVLAERLLYPEDLTFMLRSMRWGQEGPAQPAAPYVPDAG